MSLSAGYTFTVPWGELGLGLGGDTVEVPADDDSYGQEALLEAGRRLALVDIDPHDPFDIYGYINGQLLVIGLFGDPRLKKVSEFLQPPWQHTDSDCAEVLRRAYCDLNHRLAQFLPAPARRGQTTVVDLRLRVYHDREWLQLAKPIEEVLSRFYELARGEARTLRPLCDELVHDERQRIERQAISQEQAVTYAMLAYTGLWGVAHLQQWLDDDWVTYGEECLIQALIGITAECCLLRVPPVLRRQIRQAARDRAAH